MREESDVWKCQHCESLHGPHSILHFQKQEIPPHLFNHKREESLLCPSCIRNQEWKTKLLALYDPPDDIFYEETIQKYKNGLEDRFPSLCFTCRKVYHEKMRSERKWIQLNWLQSTLQSSKMEILQKSTSWSTIYFVLWILSMSLLILSFLLSTCLHIIFILYPLHVMSIEGILNYFIMLFISHLCCFLAIHMDPLWIFKFIYPKKVFYTDGYMKRAQEWNWNRIKALIVLIPILEFPILELFLHLYYFYTNILVCICIFLFIV